MGEPESRNGNNLMERSWQIIGDYLFQRNPYIRSTHTIPQESPLHVGGIWNFGRNLCMPLSARRVQQHSSFFPCYPYCWPCPQDLLSSPVDTCARCIPSNLMQWWYLRASLTFSSNIDDNSGCLHFLRTSSYGLSCVTLPEYNQMHPLLRLGRGRFFAIFFSSWLSGKILSCCFSSSC